MIINNRQVDIKVTFTKQKNPYYDKKIYSYNSFKKHHFVNPLFLKFPPITEKNIIRNYFKTIYRPHPPHILKEIYNTLVWTHHHLTYYTVNNIWISLEVESLSKKLKYSTIVNRIYLIHSVKFHESLLDKHYDRSLKIVTIIP